MSMKPFEPFPSVVTIHDTTGKFANVFTSHANGKVKLMVQADDPITFNSTEEVKAFANALNSILRNAAFVGGSIDA